jgi:hypothetical protein
MYAALARVRPALFAVRKFLEKALTISGVDRFTGRGSTCRLHAMFMNQLCIIWGYQKELSSTAGHGEKNSPREYDCPQHLSERTLTFRETIRVQPCIRPLNAAAMAAGPDVIR